MFTSMSCLRILLGYRESHYSNSILMMFHLVCLESPLDTYFFSQYSHLIFRIKECVLYVFSESQANQQFLNFKIYFIWIYYMVPKIYIDFEDTFTNFTLNFKCIYFIFKSHISNSMLIVFHLVCL